jgi:hypothetical protein
MMEAVQDGFEDDGGEMMEMVAQSGFLLDLFDRGMSATFHFLISDEIDHRDDEIYLGKLTEHLMEKISVLNENPEIVLEIDIEPDFCVKNNAYLMKSIFMITIYEALKNASGKLLIKGAAPLLTLTSENTYSDLPAVIQIFTEMFRKARIDLSYDSNTISMRFNNENPDCGR